MSDGFHIAPFAAHETGEPAWAIVVHGGAGDVPLESDRLEGCRAAVGIGASVLRAGGSALDAVEQAVRVLEDDPRFNAGKGSVLNEGGLIELDAAIMEGSTLRAGGVCALPPFANPVSIARAVLEAGVHVLYAGAGAAQFARSHGFAPLTSDQMTTSRARACWEVLRSQGAEAADRHDGGTVGAVACDGAGRCAAATSTGGILGKRFGRVGDSPVIGAGTFADEEGAASATGHGELIMRVCLTKRALDALRQGLAPERAAEGALDFLRQRLNGTAGMIVVDCRGRVGIARSTRQMAWAACRAGVLGAAAGS